MNPAEAEELHARAIEKREAEEAARLEKSSATKAPHRPAAFINAIAEEGDKAEAVKYLQEQWNENCQLREQLAQYKQVCAAAYQLAGTVMLREGARRPLRRARRDRWQSPAKKCSGI